LLEVQFQPHKKTKLFILNACAQSNGSLQLHDAQVSCYNVFAHLKY